MAAGCKEKLEVLYFIVAA